MAESVIEVDNLITGYGRAATLSDVSFKVARGEIRAIIGKSGCGKTTLLKNLLGLMPYRQGSVKVLGAEIRDPNAVAKEKVRTRTGVLFQRGALINSMTLAENVGLPLEMFTDKDEPTIAQEVRHLLSLVGLSHALSKFPTELSGGMVKRAALARAMALHPEILFCDEPSAGLDPVTTRDIDHLLLSLKAEFNMTVVVVTHDILSIERIADSILMIKGGRTAYDGPTKNLSATDNEALRDFFLVGEGAISPAN